MPTVQLPLSHDKLAQLDAEDLPLTEGYSWRARLINGTWYAIGKRKRSDGRVELVMLHRLVFGATRGSIVDHRNGDGLDCRKANLRYATRGQNAANASISASNTSGFKGVSWHKGMGRWQAQCSRRALGYFRDPVSAAMAYDDAARKFHGEFAVLNFPKEGERRFRP